MKILIFCDIPTIGIGDCLCMTPLISFFAKFNNVYVSVPKERECIFGNMDRVTIISKEERKLTKFDISYCLGQIRSDGKPDCIASRVESYEHKKFGFMRTPRNKIFADYCHVILDDYKPKYVITKDEDEKIKKILKEFNDTKYNLALQLSTSEKNREYPYNLELIDKLKELSKKLNITLFLIDNGNIGIINETKQDKKEKCREIKLTLRETIALINNMDLLITPDTYSIHASGIRDIRTIMLCFPKAPNQFLIYNANILHTDRRCYPCSRHKNKDCIWNGFDSYCKCAEDISVEDIIKQVRIELMELKR